MSYSYNLVQENNHRSISIFFHDGQCMVANEDHPSIEYLIDAVTSNASADYVRHLFDIQNQVAAQFESVSERVSLANGQVLFDGQPVHNTLTETVLRFYQRREDFQPLVNFFEKIMTNIDAHVRDQLYDWINDRNLTITPDGDLIAYKGVRQNSLGQYVSINSGPGIVDNQQMHDNLPNNPGSVVEIARDYVDTRSDVGCSTGLHVGTWEYAENFGRGVVVTTKVNPRDVISVPTDCDAQKMRVCRYKVLDITHQQYNDPIVHFSDCDCESCYDIHPQSDSHTTITCPRCTRDTLQVYENSTVYVCNNCWLELAPDEEFSPFPDVEELHFHPLTELPLSMSTINWLHARGFRNVGELLGTSTEILGTLGPDSLSVSHSIQLRQELTNLEIRTSDSVFYVDGTIYPITTNAHVSQPHTTQNSFCPRCNNRSFTQGSCGVCLLELRDGQQFVPYNSFAYLQQAPIALLEYTSCPPEVISGLQDNFSTIGQLVGLELNAIRELTGISIPQANSMSDALCSHFYILTGGRPSNIYILEGEVREVPTAENFSGVRIVQCPRCTQRDLIINVDNPHLCLNCNLRLNHNKTYIGDTRVDYTQPVEALEPHIDFGNISDLIDYNISQLQDFFGVTDRELQRVLTVSTARLSLTLATNFNIRTIAMPHGNVFIKPGYLQSTEQSWISPSNQLLPGIGTHSSA